MQFFFENHILDVDRRELRRGSELIALEPQVFDLLVYLIQNRDRVVSKDDLIDSVWGGRIVSDSTLASRINAVRKAVGDSGEEQKAVRTIARRVCALSAQSMSKLRQLITQRLEPYQGRHRRRFTSARPQMESALPMRSRDKARRW